MQVIPYVFFGLLALAAVVFVAKTIAPARENKRELNKYVTKSAISMQTIRDIENMTRDRMQVYGITPDDQMILERIHKHHTLINKEITK